MEVSEVDEFDEVDEVDEVELTTHLGQGRQRGLHRRPARQGR